MNQLIPRGIQNNNPFNIRHSKNQWQGQAVKQNDLDFVTFENPIAGIRAAMKILINYCIKYHLATVWELISRWAPPSDNNPTDVYAANVAKHMGVGVNDEVNIITDEDMMIKMVQQMAIQENGHPESYPNWLYKNEPYWYTRNIYESAWLQINKPLKGK